jgi:hypothetical protein
MHRVLLLAAGLTALAGCSRSSTTAEGVAAPAPAGFQGELLQVEKDWSAALTRRDTAFFERTLADDFIEVGGEKTETKRDFLANLAGPPDNIVPAHRCWCSNLTPVRAHHNHYRGRPVSDQRAGAVHRSLD